MAYIQVLHHNQVKETIELTPPTVIGRKPENDIVLENPGVSGEHARIEVRGDNFHIIDLNSTNGTFVNGEKINETPLASGDRIAIFKQELRFQMLLGDNDQMSSTVYSSGAAARGSNDSALSPDSTVMIDGSRLDEMLSQHKLEQASKQGRTLAKLDIAHKDGGKSRFKLEKTICLIGKKSLCDIQTQGWLAPAISAKIVRKSDGSFVLVPEDKVMLNGRRIREEQPLSAGDLLKVRNLNMRFSLELSQAEG